MAKDEYALSLIIYMVFRFGINSFISLILFFISLYSTTPVIYFSKSFGIELLTKFSTPQKTIFELLNNFL